MKKNVLKCLIGAFLFVQSVSSQNNPEKTWKLLLENKRDLALKEIEAKYSSNKSIENVIGKELIQYENGMIKPSSTFLGDFKAIKNNEPYLYALWNQQFLFQEYTSNGFNANNMKVVDELYNNQYVNPTIKGALSYIKGVKERGINNFVGYEKYVKEVESIRDWEYCAVFENLNNSGINAYYGPEDHAKSGEPFNANSNGFLNWYKAPANVEPWQMLTNHAEYGSGVHYAQTFVTSPIDQEVYVRIGNSSKFIVSINDIQIFEGSKNLSTDLDAYVVKIQLKKGVNRLLLKMAEDESFGFFMVRLTDKEGINLKNLTVSSNFAEYNKSTLDELNPVFVENEFELFFRNKCEANPDDFLSAYCLIKTYLRNEKHEQAYEVLEPWLKEYPKSSILRIIALKVFSLSGEDNLIDEIRENLKKDDPSYHLSLFIVFSDAQELFRMSQQNMEEVIDSYVNSVEDPTIKHFGDMYKAIRLQDKNRVIKNLDKLISIANTEKNVNTLKSYANLFEGYLNDNERAKKIYEQINSKYFDVEVRENLVGFYANQANFAKGQKLLEENAKFLPSDIEFLKSLVNYMHYIKEYDKSMPYIDKILVLYPYSFIAMELKGDVLLQADKKVEAMEWYQKSLLHNSGNSELRKKIRDISNEKDYIEDFITKDVYKFIESKKSKITTNNYGYNILLDEVTVELYKEAGGKGRYTYVYEITSDAGVERLKEYDLGLSGSYNIIKSEIIKSDGKIIPADKMRSSFVFNGLEVGDIIYIDYQSDFNGYGRFFRDFTDDYQFTSFSPLVEGKYTLLVPKDRTISYEVKNGKLDFEQSQKGDYNVYSWSLKNHNGMTSSEKYMPESSEVQTVLHIGTIKSWTEIANWYSDLVGQQIEINSVVKKAFNEIFPNGFDKISEFDRAKKIYDYMAEKLSYSYVSFKQSGYVPQKPGKTLTTKLGDCKDFSTLFVVLTEMAGLKSNLVLVSTNDNGITSLVLPNIGFNHCIAKVFINGKARYIELTDRNLPFTAMPIRDVNAQILDIPRAVDKAFVSKLENLQDPNKLKNIQTNNVTINVNKENQKIKITTEMAGSIKSSSADVFNNEGYQIIKKKLMDRFESIVGENCTIDTVYNIENVRIANSIKYSADLTFKEKASKIGKYFVLKVPYIENAYTADLISEEKRDYQINYLDYENTDEYRTTFDVYIADGNIFTEIPANTELTFKNHSYSRKYTKVAPNHLRITVVAKTSFENISVEDYAKFKDYVSKILEAKDSMIGFE